MIFDDINDDCAETLGGIMQASRNILFRLLAATLLTVVAPSVVRAQNAAPAKPKATQQPSAQPPPTQQPATQQPAAKPSAAPPSDAAAPPQSGWRTNCTSIARANPPDCSVDQRLTLTNTGQLLTSISVRIDGKTRQPALMVQLPHGLYLPDGVTLRVDEGEFLKLDLQTCDNAGCYAGAPAPNKLLDAMSSGTQLKLLFKDLSRKDITVAMPLVGFRAALVNAK